YGLRQLHLPVRDRVADPGRGLAFHFCADEDTAGDQPALTGHESGIITVNVAEADDSERERRRVQLHEPYRTLLGHFRHEVGHYYWDRLIRGSERIEAFRTLFGDERADYAAALRNHYDNGPVVRDWEASHVSAYAAIHPWEDWAETWAHYLHIADTLETAAACGLSLRPEHANDPALEPLALRKIQQPTGFDQLIADWFPVTYVLNNLNRGMGLPDAYPFVLSVAAIEKLRFVHTVIAAARPAT
ncbi:MAG: zinc-binding metallopeptidase family protein, partial [Steroidobacteraceae bacterium]